MKLELQYWMLGCYPNSNAKPRGSSLKTKVQAFVSWTFVNIYVDLHILIRPYIQIYVGHNTQQSHTCRHTYVEITIHILANAYIHTYMII